MSGFQPAYLKAYETGDLSRRAEKAAAAMGACTLCPRRCGVDRLAGETGVCRTGRSAWVASYDPHFGEEAPLVGSGGSGTIFFTHCNLMCVFCQNWEISHGRAGRPVSDTELGEMMIRLQEMGCHNINFVSPSHVVAQILSGLEAAVKGGLRIPLVYNSGGYDRIDTLKLLEGVVDIYMPDFKFWDESLAEKSCDAPDYPEVAREALREMHRQVGDLEIGDDGLARRGLLVRHLVLPGGIAGTREIMGFLAREISRDTYVNIMPQYRPCGRSREFPELADYPSRSDFQAAITAAKEEGIHRLDQRRRVFMLG
jgi:putative pyruvate formate lyase activating enzyme